MPDQHSPSVGPDDSSRTVLLAVVVVFGVTGTLICGGVIGGAYFMAKEVQQQIADQRQTAQEKAKGWQAFQRFENSRRGLGHAAALELLDEMIEQFPEEASFHNEKAWLLATCSEDSIRDGQQAIEHARIACKLTDWSDAALLDTLAAAYAEVGDFERAVVYQQQAVDHHSGPDLGMTERLQLFQDGKPYRQASD